MFEFMQLKGESDSGRSMFPSGEGWLICEFGGDTKAEAADRAQGLIEAFRTRPNPPSMKFFDDPEQQVQLWAFRDNALGATSKIPNQADYYPGWEDSAVDPEAPG